MSKLLAMLNTVEDTPVDTSSRMLSVGDSRVVKNYDLTSGTPVLDSTFTYTYGTLQDIGWSYNGRLQSVFLSSVGVSEKALYLYDWYSGTPAEYTDVSGIFTNLDGGITVNWSPSTYMFVTNSTFFDCKTPAQPTVLYPADYYTWTDDGMYNGHWHASGRYYLTGDYSDTGIVIYDVRPTETNAAIMGEFASSLGANGSDIDWRPDGSIIAAVTSSTPYIHFYTWNGTPQSSVKMSNPGTLPAGTGQCARWSPDGRYCAVGHSTTPFVTVYDFDSGSPVKISNPASLPTASVVGLAWSADSRYLACTHGTSRYITIYDFDTGSPVKLTDPVSLPTTSGLCCEWSPNGRYLFIGHSVSPWLTIYDFDSGLPVKISNPSTTGMGSGDSFDHITFSSDGKYVACINGSTASPKLYVYDWDTQTLLAEPSDLLPDTPKRAYWESDNRTLVINNSTTTDATPKIWKYDYSSGVGVLLKKSLYVSADFNPSYIAKNPAAERYIAAASSYNNASTSDLRITVIDWESSRPHKILGLPTVTNALRHWSPDGSKIAFTRTSGGTICSIYTWDTDTESMTLVYNNADSLTGVGIPRFNDQGTKLAVTKSSTPFIYFLNTANTNTITLYSTPASLPPNEATQVRWSPDGRYCAFAHSSSPYLVVYDFNSGSPVKLANPGTLPSTSCSVLRWSADSKYIAIGGGSAGIQLYDISSGSLVYIADPSPAFAAPDNNSLAFNPPSIYV